MCYKDFLRVQKAMNPKELNEMIDEKEECLTDCFKPRKGTTESVYCVEKCNETFNMRLEKTVLNVRDAMKDIMKS